MKNLLAVLIILSLGLASCSKYEEGPSLSLRTKKARVVGDWKVVYQALDGVEETLDEDDKDDTWSFKKDDSYEIVDPGFDTETGSWEFTDSKESITMSDGSGLALKWTIVKLANDELWLSADFLGTKNEYRLEPR